MYSLRNRDLTSLVGGAEASEAAKAEPWLDRKEPTKLTHEAHTDGVEPRKPPQLTQLSKVGLEKNPKNFGKLASHASRIYGKKRRLPHTTRDRARPGSASLGMQDNMNGLNSERPASERDEPPQPKQGIATDDVTAYLEIGSKYQELAQAYKELKIRFDNRGSEMSKLHERIRKLERQILLQPETLFQTAPLAC